MAKKTYARRYAQAVFEMALGRKELELWQADLQKIAATVADANVLAALESPRVKLDDKTRLLVSLVGKINLLALNLVGLLISRSAIGMAGEISAEYQRRLDEYHGVVPAGVVTAVPLDDADRKKLAGDLGKMVGKEVVIEAEVDPEILGGIIARVGGKLLDGSTRSKLAALRRELVGGERKR